MRDRVRWSACRE